MAHRGVSNDREPNRRYRARLAFMLIRIGVSPPRTIAAMVAEINESELYATTLRPAALPNPGIRDGWKRRGGDLKNVIATLPGNDLASGAVVIVGAHYDSTSSDPQDAPGATDNGCGVSIVLELVRVMSRYSFNHTVQFAFWNAEEIGRRGSRSYAQFAADNVLDIPLYLNYDSACFDPNDRSVLNVLYSVRSKGIAELMIRHTALYGIDLTLTGETDTYLPDHLSFWSRGYPAIMTHAPSRGPAHTPEDTVDRVSFRYAEKNAQPGLSVLARVAGLQGTASQGRYRLPDERGSCRVPGWAGHERGCGRTGRSDA